MSGCALSAQSLSLNVCLLVLRIIIECLSEALYDLGPQCHQGSVPCTQVEKLNQQSFRPQMCYMADFVY